MPRRQGAEVNAYADAFGRWHATVQVKVPDGVACDWTVDDMNRAARRKMLAEMRLRENNVSAKKVQTSVELFRTGYIHIKEKT